MINGLSEVEVVGPLDRGANSHVFRVRHRQTHKQLVRHVVKKAMKVVKWSSKDSPVYRRLQNEIAIHKLLHHPNVVKFQGSFDHHNDLYIFTECCEQGSMEQLMGSRHLEMNQIRDLAQQVVQGLAYLHEMKMVHRDLKLSNIFLSEQLEVKIGDFGYAVNEGEEQAVVCGTPKYMSPEVISKQPYGCKTDIWALGVLIYQMVCHCSPFEAGNYPELFALIRKGKYVLDPSIEPQLRSIIIDCLQFEADKRPTAKQLLNHELFHGPGLIRRRLEPDFEEKTLLDIFSLLDQFDQGLQCFQLDDCELVVGRQAIAVTRGTKTITIGPSGIRVASSRKCSTYSTEDEVRAFETTHPQFCEWLFSVVGTILETGVL